MADENRSICSLQIIQNPPSPSLHHSRPSSPEPSYFTLDRQGYTGHMRDSYRQSGDSEAMGTPLSLPPSPRQKGPTTAENWDPWSHGTQAQMEKKTLHAVATPLPPSPCPTLRLHQRRRPMTPLSLGAGNGHAPQSFDLGDPRKSLQRPLTPCCSAAELRMPPSPHVQSQRSSLATPPPRENRHQRRPSLHPHYSHSSLVLDAVATSLPPSPGPSTPGSPRPQRPSLAPPSRTARRRYHSYQGTPYTCQTPMAFGPCASPPATPRSDDDDASWCAQRRFSAPPSSIDLRRLAEGHRPVPPRQYHEPDPLDKNFNPGRRPSITGGMPPGKCCGLCNIGPAAAAANWTGAFLTYVVLLVVAGCGKTGCFCLGGA